MALPTGTISMNDVNIELDKASGSTISLNDADVRKLAKVPSGIISMNDLRGKSRYDLIFTVTVGHEKSGPAADRLERWGYKSGAMGSMSTYTFYGIPISSFLLQIYQYDKVSCYIGASNSDHNLFGVLSNKVLDCLTTGQSFTMGYDSDGYSYVKINETGEWRTLMQGNVEKTLSFGFRPK